MDRGKLINFINYYEFNTGNLMIFIRNYTEWLPFYENLKSCGLDFKHPKDQSLELINYIIWIKRDNIWLSSPGKDDKIISLNDFWREYNLYCLLDS